MISFYCVLKDPLGKIISSSFIHDILTHQAGNGPGSVAAFSGFHEPIRGLLDGLQGLKKGEKRSIFVRAEQAYGFYDPSLVMTMPRRRLPQGKHLEIGYQVVTQCNDGETRVFRVIAGDPLHVTLDGNHPLAGQDLCFDIEATATREATVDEIAQMSMGAASQLLH